MAPPCALSLAAPAFRPLPRCPVPCHWLPRPLPLALSHCHRLLPSPCPALPHTLPHALVPGPFLPPNAFYPSNPFTSHAPPLSEEPKWTETSRLAATPRPGTDAEPAVVGSYSEHVARYTSSSKYAEGKLWGRWGRRGNHNMMRHCALLPFHSLLATSGAGAGCLLQVGQGLSWG